MGQILTPCGIKLSIYEWLAGEKYLYYQGNNNSMYYQGNRGQSRNRIKRFGHFRRVRERSPIAALETAESPRRRINLTQPCVQSDSEQYNKHWNKSISRFFYFSSKYIGERLRKSPLSPPLQKWWQQYNIKTCMPNYCYMGHFKTLSHGYGTMRSVSGIGGWIKPCYNYYSY